MDKICNNTNSSKISTIGPCGGSSVTGGEEDY